MNVNKKQRSHYVNEKQGKWRFITMLLMAAALSTQVIEAQALQEEKPSYNYQDDPILTGERLTLLFQAPDPEGEYEPSFDGEDRVNELTNPAVPIYLGPGSTYTLRVSLANSTDLLAQVKWRGPFGAIRLSIIKNGVVLGQASPRDDRVDVVNVVETGITGQSGDVEVRIMNNSLQNVEITPVIATFKT